MIAVLLTIWSSSNFMETFLKNINTNVANSTINHQYSNLVKVSSSRSKIWNYVKYKLYSHITDKNRACKKQVCNEFPHTNSKNTKHQKIASRFHFPSPNYRNPTRIQRNLIERTKESQRMRIIPGPVNQCKWRERTVKAKPKKELHG